MKKMNRLEFLKEAGRWGALAGLLGFGAVLLSRGKEGACHEQCHGCREYENGKCGIGLK